MQQNNPQTLVLATHNQGKLEELRLILQPLGWTLYGLNDFKLPIPDETGSTFEENAYIKAQAAFSATGRWSLADDSGLEVEFLQGGPGVFTSEYGGWERLLEVMKHLPLSKRRARFVCVLMLVRNDAPPLVLKGFSDGHISLEARGNGGFGYDPVFVPDGESRTFAEMTKAEKSRYSHRGKALKALLTWLNNLSSETV